jgi:hypothetical protein
MILAPGCREACEMRIMRDVEVGRVGTAAAVLNWRIEVGRPALVKVQARMVLGRSAVPV